MTELNNLFSPINLKNKILKNRFVLGPIDVDIGNDELFFKLLNFHKTLTFEKNLPFVIVGNSIVHCTGKKKYTDESVNTLLKKHLKITKQLHLNEALAILQLTHHGLDSITPFPLSASSLINERTNRRSITSPSLLINNIINNFVEKSIYATKRANYDGVEIDGSKLSFINSFISSTLNKRNDIWGEDRNLVAKQIISKIRKSIDKNKFIIFRISLMDLTKDGNNWKDVLTLANSLVTEGVDLFSISIGLTEDKFPINTNLTPKNIWVKFIEFFSKEITCPVIFSGKIEDFQDINKYLSNNNLVELNKNFIADKDLINKVFNCNFNKINRCIYCRNKCYLTSDILECPLSIFNKDKKTKTNPDNVLIIGAGISGIFKAIKEAKLGNNVYLLEKRERIGGYLLLAERMSSNNFSNLLKKLENQLKDLNVNVLLNINADISLIKNNFSNFNIFICTGTETDFNLYPFLSNQVNLITVDELLENDKSLGHRIAIVGNNFISRNLALLFSQNEPNSIENWLISWGISSPIHHRGGVLGVIPFLPPPLRTIYLMQLNGSEYTSNSEKYEMQWLQMNGIRTINNVQITSVSPYSVSVQTRHQNEIIKIDNIIYCENRTNQSKLVRLLKENNIDFKFLGSAAHPIQDVTIVDIFNEVMQDSN